MFESELLISLYKEDKDKRLEKLTEINTLDDVIFYIPLFGSD